MYYYDKDPLKYAKFRVSDGRVGSFFYRTSDCTLSDEASHWYYNVYMAICDGSAAYPAYCLLSEMFRVVDAAFGKYALDVAIEDTAKRVGCNFAHVDAAFVLSMQTYVEQYLVTVVDRMGIWVTDNRNLTEQVEEAKTKGLTWTMEMRDLEAEPTETDPEPKRELEPANGIEHNAEIARKFIYDFAQNDDLTNDDDPCSASIIRNICCDIEFERGVDVGDYVWVYAYELFDELATSSADDIIACLYTYADFAARYQTPVYKYGPEYVEAEREEAGDE